jgi:tetratricopeptide (TPR) repeat protein
MHSRWIVLFSLLLPIQNVSVATVSGRILDQEGKPLAGAQIIYKNIGIYDRQYRADGGMRTEAPQMVEGTGRIYRIKSDRKGAFVLAGLDFGVYQIEITGPGGVHVYSGKKTIGRDDDPGSQNILNIDLSLATRLPVEPGSGTNLAGGRKTKDQQELIRQENARAAKINRLVAQYHTSLAAEDWPSAMGQLKQLIVIDPHRWEFYQNLGTLQANQGLNKEAAHSYARGVEEAQKILANPSDTDHALTNIGDLLLAEADCYLRMDKTDDAVALYNKAAAAYPHPYMARYRACSALNNLGKSDEAAEKCNQAIADDPTQWGPYQMLGGIFTAAGKPKEALDAYRRGIAVAQKSLAEKPDSIPIKAGLGQMLNSEGNLLIQQKDYDGAIGAFLQGATTGAYPAMPYFNICTIYYNLKRGQEAVAACDLAISYDPKMAEAYYIKGAILFGKGHLEHGKYVTPPGTLDSLNKYLEYAPLGEHVRTVNEMVKQLGEKIETSRQPAKN